MEIEFGVTKLPKFDVPEEYTSWEYLNKLCHEGLVKRYGDRIDGAAAERLEYELSVIKTMGYVDYFLIVWDFIHYARDHGYHGRAGTRVCGRKPCGLYTRHHEYWTRSVITCSLSVS